MWLRIRTIIFEKIKSSWRNWRFFLVAILLVNLWISLYLTKNLEVDVPTTKLVQEFETDLESELTNQEESGEQTPKIAVSITGAVNSPGVYRFPREVIVSELIEAAGGLADNAAQLYVAKNINLSQTLSSGEQIYIPSESELDLKDLATQIPSADSNSDAGEIGLVSVNTATSEELESVPGIGPSTAANIIANRPYERVDDLLEVSGIGESTLAKIKPYLEV